MWYVETKQHKIYPIEQKYHCKYDNDNMDQYFDWIKVISRYKISWVSNPMRWVEYLLSPDRTYRNPDFAFFSGKERIPFTQILNIWKEND